MAKLLLTSNGFFTNSIKEAFLSLFEVEVFNLRAAVITTASTRKHNNAFAIKAKNDLLGMGFLQVDFIDVEFDDPKLLKQYNVIYISGGNPFYLLHYLRFSGTDLILKEISSRSDTIIVGASAGAIALGLSIEFVSYFTPHMNTVDMRDFKALAITDVTIFPHYDREELFPDSEGRSIEERLCLVERKHQFSITRLRDDEYIIIKFVCNG